jgi:hypothetical protein
MALQRVRNRFGALIGRAPLIALACLGGWLAACSSGTGIVQTAGGQAADPETQDFPIFYVKRYSVPQTQDDLRLLRFAQPSADLFMRSRASPDGVETNITQSITGTGTANAMNYDVKDVTVSADGTTVLFAMRGPLPQKIQQDMPPSWRIYQYVIATNTLTPAIDPTTDPDPLTVNDVSPSFMPDGRIVFASTRQRQEEAMDLNLGFPQYNAQDEDRTEDAAVLHVMNGDGTLIHQISFNASHDRDPSVLMNGRVMWTRWDDPPNKDGMQLYTANPDGTDLQLLYGANSHDTGPNGTATPNATIEFVKTHEMQDGRVLALIRPFQGTESATAPLGTDFGGDLVIIDTNDYQENTQPVRGGAGTSTGPAQTPATTNNVLTIPGPSPGGRFYAGFPLWDGTGRILVSWSQCRLVQTAATKTTPAVYSACTSEALASPTATAAPPIYSVWMFDPAQNTLQPITQPTDGIMITDLAAAQPRALQAVILDQQPGVGLNQDNYNAGVGVIDIRSVYDFDGVDTAKPNIQTLADPAKTTAAERPARFIRLVSPVGIPDKTVVKLSDAAFGASNFMRQIMGYAPVEPDGSVRIMVPGNLAFQIQILNANAQVISPSHNAWLQVAPGEEIHCNGCHTPAAQQNPATGQTAISHGRASNCPIQPANQIGNACTIYAGAAQTGVPFPDTVSQFSPNQGDTMAETRSRWSCSNDTPPCFAMMPSVEVLYTDVWTNTSGTGLTLNPPITYSYVAAAPPAGPAYLAFTTLAPTSNSCVATWAFNCNILINYPEHIQPLWDKTRQVTDNMGNVIADHTCTQGGCHSPTDAQGNVQVPAGQLDLSDNPSQDEPQELVSYRKAVFTHDEQTLTMGVLVDVQVGNPPTPVTISPPMLAGDALDSRFFGLFAAGGQHAGWLSPSELRLISEWLDIGAQYFNNPFDPTVPTQ